MVYIFTVAFRTEPFFTILRRAAFRMARFFFCSGLL
jgi:hypothetical protein